MKKKSKKGKSLKAAGTMNDALANKTEEIKELLVKCRQDDALARYQIAVHITDVIKDRDYGDSAVKKLAQALGWSEDKIGQYAAVVQAWDAIEFDQLLQRKSSIGKPFSWSHCVELAKLTKTKPREAAITEALEKAMTVRDLVAYLTPPRAAQADPKSISNAASTLEAVPRRLHTAIEHLIGGGHAEESNAATWCRTLCDDIDAADPSDLTPELRKQVVAARDCHERLAQTYQATMQKLNRCLAKIEQALEESQNGGSPDSAAGRATAPTGFTTNELINELQPMEALA